MEMSRKQINAAGDSRRHERDIKAAPRSNSLPFSPPPEFIYFSSAIFPLFISRTASYLLIRLHGRFGAIISSTRTVTMSTSIVSSFDSRRLLYCASVKTLSHGKLSCLPAVIEAEPLKCVSLLHWIDQAKGFASSTRDLHIKRILIAKKLSSSSFYCCSFLISLITRAKRWT